MSTLAKQMIGESQTRATAPVKGPVLKVIEATRQTTYMVCPHCKQEIHEKHTYSPDNGITEVHSDCGGQIEFPETPMEDIPAWLRPSVQQVRDKRAAGQPLW